MFGDNKVIIRTSLLCNTVAAEHQIGNSYELVDEANNSDIYTSGAV